MRISVLMICLSLIAFKMNSQRDTLIYVGDPMCSWCYGFSPELDKVKAAFPNVPVKMIMGGLRIDGTETMGDLGAFLHDHWVEINERTGQKFKNGILKQASVVYNTEPACRAVVTMSKLKPEVQYEFFKAVQASFYYHNDVPGLAATYAKVATQFGVSEKDFKAMFESDAIKKQTRSDFEAAKNMGVSGFPTLLAKIQGKVYLVTNGYAPADKIISALKNKQLK